MICLDDLIGLCDLTADQVHAIAEHEHVADPLAAALARPCFKPRTDPSGFGASSKMTFARRFAGTIFLMLGISSRRCGNSYTSILARAERKGRARQRPLAPARYLTPLERLRPS